jgi:hypothetical protein
LPRTSRIRPENKVGNRGVFFASQKRAAKAPRLPRITPQIHHENTTFCTLFFANTPAKTQFHHARKKFRKSDGKI